jgi:hypothetical protein
VIDTSRLRKGMEVFGADGDRGEALAIRAAR